MTYAARYAWIYAGFGFLSTLASAFNAARLLARGDGERGLLLAVALVSGFGAAYLVGRLRWGTQQAVARGCVDLWSALALLWLALLPPALLATLNAQSGLGGIGAWMGVMHTAATTGVGPVT